MLRFFRNIRHKLIQQENIRKYIWYALGEILLVMIGILLALQVNNWNEQRKQVSQEEFLLTELEKEFRTNLELIERDYAGNKKTRDAVLRILELFDTPYKSTAKELDSLVVTVFTSTSFDPTRGVVDDIISTGKLSLLRDDSLRYMISQWPSIIQNQDEDIEIRWSHFETFLLPEMARNYPMKNANKYFDFSFWSDDYKRVDLPLSDFSFHPENFYTREMEGLLYIHSLNQDFILMNDLETKKYILAILERIRQNKD